MTRFLIIIKSRIDVGGKRTIRLMSGNVFVGMDYDETRVLCRPMYG